MQRSALSVLALVALVLGVLPLWGGCEAQRTFEALDEQMRGALPGEVEAETGFARGWLRSRGQTRIDGAGGGLILHHTVTHGPLPVAELLAGRAPWPPVRALIDTAGWLQSADIEREEPWLRARTRLQLDGAIDIGVESAPRTFGEAFVWGGLEASLISPRANIARGVMWAPQLEIGVEGGRIALRDVAAELDLRVGEDGVPLGTAMLVIGSLHGAGPLGDFSIEEARLELSAEEGASAGTCGFEWSETVERVSSDADRYGPGAIRLIARRLDCAALGALFAAAGEDATADADAWQRLLAHSPELELDTLEMAGPEGVLRARGRVGIDGDDPRAAMGPLFAALAVEASAEILVPARWLHHMLDQVISIQMQGVGAASAQQQVEVVALRSAWIRDLVSAGWLVRDGEGYRLELDYRGGQLLLNRRPLDPSAMASLQRIAY